MTIRIGIVSLKFDAGAWVSRLMPLPQKKGYGFMLGLHLCCGSGILPRNPQVMSVEAEKPLPQKKDLSQRTMVCCGIGFAAGCRSHRVPRHPSHRKRVLMQECAQQTNHNSDQTISISGTNNIMQRRKTMKVAAIIKSCVCLLFCSGLSCTVPAAQPSPYMGGDVNLTKAPNGPGRTLLWCHR
jgi:hypothetical protein